MKLGIKIHYPLFFNKTYKEHLNKFDVWYVNSDIYSHLDKLDEIYKECYNLGKEMYGYYLFSSRWSIPRYKNLNFGEMRAYAINIINRYPLISKWELCHEDIADDGNIRANNIYYKKFGNNWKQNIYKIAKNQYPEKNFYYGDYIRSYKKADKIIEFVDKTKEVDGINFQIHSDISKPIPIKLIKYVINNLKKDVVCLETIVWNINSFSVKINGYLLRDMIKATTANLLYISKSNSLNIQAQRYKTYKNVCDRNNVSIFGIWCLTDVDKDSISFYPWQNTPGLLDKELNTKQAYKSIFS